MTQKQTNDLTTRHNYNDIDFADLSIKICSFLDEQKSESITSIDLRTKCSFTDGMIIASGRSQRHIKAVAEKLKQFLHEIGITEIRLEGTTSCDWVLIDADIVIVHLFRPEIRDFYGLEKMWTKDQETKEADFSVDSPK